VPSHPTALLAVRVPGGGSPVFLNPSSISVPAMPLPAQSPSDRTGHCVASAGGDRSSSPSRTTAGRRHRKASRYASPPARSCCDAAPAPVRSIARNVPAGATPRCDIFAREAIHAASTPQ
jgi:hypothetical protein